jgi:hypothetical protein
LRPSIGVIRDLAGTDNEKARRLERRAGVDGTALAARAGGIDDQCW